MAINTTNTPRAWSPDIHVFEPGDVIGDALVLTHSTVAGQIEGDEPVVRVAYVDDAAADFVAEGAEIPEDDPTLSEATVATGKVATLVRVSREQYLQSGAAGMLSDSMRRAVVTRANEAFISQPAPSGGAVTPPAGLLNVDGLAEGSEVGDNLDPLIDLVSQITADGGHPSGVLLSPQAWGALQKIKTGDGSAQGLLGAGAGASQTSLLGLPVAVSPAVPAFNGMVIDKGAIVSAAGKVQVASSDDVYFSSDSVGLRVTFRFGATVVRPERLGVFTVANGNDEV